LKSAGDVSRVVQEAFYIAGTGRPGPVLIDIPKDVSTGMAEDVKLPEKVVLRGYNPTYKGHKRQIEKALELLGHAERPLIYAGGGIISSNASP
jgi:acetolactate synthase-1/2/3 large subunit